MTTGFDQYKHSDWLQYSDLPAGGGPATITHATHDLQENFRTKEKEMKVTLFFAEYKPMTLTNKNLGHLQACFPDKDATTIGVERERVWLEGKEVDAFGAMKTVVRIHELKTMRMQPDPAQSARAEDPAQPAPDASAGENRDEGAPPPTDDDDIPF